MASKKKPILLKNWQENYASFILGAIIIVILGLLVANFITNRTGNILDLGNDEQMTTDEESKQEVTVHEYTVKENDSLSKIAESEYGDKMLWPVLARLNDISNPDLIYIDTTLKLPSKEEINKIKEDMTITSYKVLAGDTLFKIAEKVYGDGNQWGRIGVANNVGRLPNGNPLIFAGSTITIPR
ncbi:MAG: LysM domain protein [Candidatus Curtissbacteria bacterium GW2011_GWA1_40_9]|uniref:LysM domain protein n=1 Tax=Candidatus Curtissbacteria bacterium GW2011_GWA1_40_9 TaxID=1618408 RepID=A0A0G0TM98_9BACT|nr:MAG: LysM domain protein [Candidatus Curtissbacteria bacterium GW2011_GWA1_40_9]